MFRVLHIFSWYTQLVVHVWPIGHLDVGQCVLQGYILCCGIIAMCKVLVYYSAWMVDEQGGE